MRLLEIEVFDFKKIKYLKATIPEDTRVILVEGAGNSPEGDNGVGKSALFDAIGLILINDLPEKMSTYIRWGAKRFQIRLKFKQHDRVYEAFLKVHASSTPTERWLQIEGEPEPATGSEAVAKMATILPPTLTKYSALSRQFQSAEILKAGDSKRLAHLKAIFGVDIVDIAASLGKDREAEYKNRVVADTATLEALKNSLLTMTTQEEFELPSIEDTKQALDKIQIYKDAHDLKSQQYNDYLRQKKKWDDTQVQLEELSAAIEKAEAELEAATNQLQPVLPFNAAAYTALGTKIKELRAQETTLAGEISTALIAQKEVDDLKVLIHRDETNLSAATSSAARLKEAQHSLLERREAWNKARLAVAQLSKELELAEAGKCSQCGQDWHGSSAADLKAQVESTQQEVRLLQPQVSALEVTVQEASTAQDKVANLTKSLADAKGVLNLKEAKLIVFGDVKQLQAKHLKVDEELVQAEAQYEVFQANFQEHQQAVEANRATESAISQFKMAISSHEGKIEVLEQVTEPTVVAPPGTFTQQEQYQELQKSLNVYEAKVEELARIKAHNKGVEQLRTAAQQDIDRIQARIEQTDRNIETVRKARLFLSNQFAAHLVQEGSTYVQWKMNDFFQRTYKHLNVVMEQAKQAVSFMYSGEEGIKTPVSLAGGFEQECLSMAFRRALCSLQDSGIMLLDEVDTAAADAKSLQLYKMLLQEKDIEQIVCITHRPQTREMLKNERSTYVLRIEDAT